VNVVGKRDLVVIGQLSFIIGIYLFPGGYDIILKAAIDMAGGDYWLGTLYLYAITYSMIIIGITLSKPQIIRKVGGPLKFAALAIAGFVIIYLAMSGILG